MSDSYTVIVENDVSQWEDKTGRRYHFPKRYARYLTAGTQLIHYKGRLTSRAFAADRLSPHPHYFAVSTAGAHSPDPASEKGDLFLEILDYHRFDRAVPIRVDGDTVEMILENRRTNFWRDGVRPTSVSVFRTVAETAGLMLVDGMTKFHGVSPVSDEDLTSAFFEGSAKMVYSARYERRPELRAKAIEIHGVRCAACDLDMSETYGDLGEGYIQVHHKRPLSTLDGPVAIDPAKDLVPLCPNCHCMIHRPKDSVLTVSELRAILGKSSISARAT